LPGVLLHRRKTVSLIVLGLLFAAIMVSCGKSDGPRERMALSNKNVLRYDVTAPFTSLNPNAVKFSGSNHIFPLLYSYLFVHFPVQTIFSLYYIAIFSFPMQRGNLNRTLRSVGPLILINYIGPFTCEAMRCFTTSGRLPQMM